MRIGIIGGSGYVGGELLRLLLLHPQVEVTTVTSRASVGEYIFNLHPNLRGLTQLKFVPQDIVALQKNCDLVFTATPHGGSVNLVPKLLEAGLKVIDMSADFRLKNPSAYETWYGWKHAHPELLKEAAYGSTRAPPPRDQEHSPRCLPRMHGDGHNPRLGAHNKSRPR